MSAENSKSDPHAVCQALYLLSHLPSLRSALTDETAEAQSREVICVRWKREILSTSIPIMLNSFVLFFLHSYLLCYGNQTTHQGSLEK